MDSYFKKKLLDRINRIVRIMRPSAERPLAAGEKNLYPVKSSLCETSTALISRLIASAKSISINQKKI
ncbi:hypothetical protein D1AOALGA4SA_3334 [Olavius algarvensis Delta 1 endosymbiont]|nr:hypothetical protein D1AOALGA4SA_3334 [Olavius algarvensis Delta 1 endosymbiont]